MIKLSPDFVSAFHRLLATPEWLAELERFVTERVFAQEEFQTDEGSGSVSADPDGGDFSFKVRASVHRFPGDSWKDRYEAFLKWDPEGKRFQMTWERKTTVERTRSEQLQQKLSIRDGTPEAEQKLIETLKQTDCPVCDTRLRVEFWPEGQSWWCRCPKGKDHFGMRGYSRNWKDFAMTWKDYIVDRTCPKCKTNKDVVGILYGLVRDPSRVDDTLWTLGGCVVREERWHCRRCNTEW